MRTQPSNSTFASSNPQAEASACKRAILCLSHRAENKRTAPKTKQPFQLTNFSPLGAMTAWTWRNCVRIIIKTDYFTAFYAFVAPLSGFFSSCVHNLKLKRLTTCSTLNVERLLATFFSSTNFHFFSDCCSWSFYSFPSRNKESCSSISNSGRRFTHFKSIYQLILCFQLKGLKAYPLIFYFIYVYGKA